LLVIKPRLSKLTPSLGTYRTFCKVAGFYILLKYIFIFPTPSAFILVLVLPYLILVLVELKLVKSSLYI
jgi:hypothetical protein